MMHHDPDAATGRAPDESGDPLPASAEAENTRLEELLLEGLQTGEEIEVTPAFWKQLRKDAGLRLDVGQVT